MSLECQAFGIAAMCAALAACGCSSSGKVAAIESQNRTLSEQTRAQLAEIENLKIHSRTVEDRLIRAEEDLARGFEDSLSSGGFSFCATDADR